MKLTLLGRLGAFLAAASLAATGPAAAQTRSAQERAQLLESYGGAYEGPMAAYVRQVGERMANAAGQGGRCTFTVINTDVINAFAAPPGCDIYITRGLLGLIRTEGELAAVLGHEVGHVAANHAGQRQTRSAITGIGAAILGAVTGSGAVAQIASQAGQLNVLSYSRGQEFEADALGARYLAQGGYTPFALADMLSALQASDQLETLDRGAETKAEPVWSRTHPLTGDRIARAVEEARRTGVPPGTAPDGQQAYLGAVDGLIWGDDPEQGVVRGRRFLHAGLGVGFTAPQGAKLTNSPRAVVIQGPGSLRAQFGAAPQAGSLEDAAYAVLRKILGQTPAQTGGAERTRINGVEAVVLPAQAQGSSGLVDLTVATYAVGRDVFYFVTLAPAGQGRTYDALIGSLHRLTPAELAEARPRRIRVVTARPGDTPAVLAQRMAVDDHALETFLAINGLEPGDALRPGQRLKIVSAAP